MSPQIKYAHKTHNTWVYRRTYPKAPKALQDLLGSALKQSLKTGDAREAKLHVAELNQTFTTIIKEAQAHALATPNTVPPSAAQGPRLAVGRPRYQRARLVGERLAWLALHVSLRSTRVSLWHPRPRPVSSSRCPSSLTGVLVKES